MYIFLQIELLDWEGEDISPNKDKSIEKYQIDAGKPHASPEDNNLVDG